MRQTRSCAARDWTDDISEAEPNDWRLRTLETYTYDERVKRAKRPEECDETLLDGIWSEVNVHLGTRAFSLPDLVEQLGLARFGHRPKLADTFCGGGSIPFEAARIGCDVYASDLNPIACMLTWGGEERLKQLLPDLGRNAAAVVAHTDFDGFAEIVRRDFEGWPEIRLRDLAAALVGGRNLYARENSCEPGAIHT